MAEEVKAGAESQVISEEQLRKAEEYVQQEEGAANRLAGWVGVAVTGIAVTMTLFHLYAAYDIVPTQELRYIHVAFVLLLSFLLFPLASRFRNPCSGSISFRHWPALPSLSTRSPAATISSIVLRSPTVGM